MQNADAIAAQAARERVQGLSDDKVRELCFYLIGFFELADDPRFPQAVELFFGLDYPAPIRANCGHPQYRPKETL